MSSINLSLAPVRFNVISASQRERGGSFALRRYGEIGYPYIGRVENVPVLSEIMMINIDPSTLLELLIEYSTLNSGGRLSKKLLLLDTRNSGVARIDRKVYQPNQTAVFGSTVEDDTKYWGLLRAEVSP